MTLNGYFTLNFFVKLKFKIYLFTYTDSAKMISKEDWTSMRAGHCIYGVTYLALYYSS